MTQSIKILPCVNSYIFCVKISCYIAMFLFKSVQSNLNGGGGGYHVRK
jgi:hypothetical protein